MEKSKTNTQKAAKFKVKVTKNGPYIVSGGVLLSEQIMCVDKEGQCHGWKEGQKYPQQETYALCRCGHSSSKPFCDGTHTKVKFDGTETASRKPYLEQAGEIVGPGLKLTDVQNPQIHHLNGHILDFDDKFSYQGHGNGSDSNFQTRIGVLFKHPISF